MFVPSSLRSASLLHFLLFNPKQKEKHQNDILSTLSLLILFRAGNATCHHHRLSSAQGSPAPYRRDVPPHGQQSRPREKYSVAGLGLRQWELQRRTFEATAPAHRRLVNPPLLVRPLRFANRAWREVDFLQRAPLRGVTAPGLMTALSTSRSRTVRAPRTLAIVELSLSGFGTLTPATAHFSDADWCQASALTGNGGLTLSAHSRRTLTPADLRFLRRLQARALTA